MGILGIGARSSPFHKSQQLYLHSPLLAASDPWSWAYAMAWQPAHSDGPGGWGIAHCFAWKPSQVSSERHSLSSSPASLAAVSSLSIWSLLLKAALGLSCSQLCSGSLSPLQQNLEPVPETRAFPRHPLLSSPGPVLGFGQRTSVIATQTHLIFPLYAWAWSIPSHCLKASLCLPFDLVHPWPTASSQPLCSMKCPRI